MPTCYEKPHYRRGLGGGNSDKPSPQERAPVKEHALGCLLQFGVDIFDELPAAYRRAQ